ALIVLGPTRLPEAARQVGKAMGELRRLSTGFQNELRDALAESEAAASPRRDVLASPPPKRSGVADAVTSVSDQGGTRRPRRRAPLRAVPLEAVGDDEPGAAGDGSPAP